MTPAELARRLFRDQCDIGPNSTLEAYGETAAVAAMVPLIEALEAIANLRIANDFSFMCGGPNVATFARAALTPQPEKVA